MSANCVSNAWNFSVQETPNDHPAWWQWPTVLSLDAPAVALAWQFLFARVAAAALQSHHYALLAAVTWLVYAADRWTEGFEIDVAQVQTHRHRFYQRFRIHVGIAMGLISLGALGLAVRTLTPHEWQIGGLLTLPVAAYLIIGPLLRRLTPWRLPKEVLIALLFSLGSACFSLANTDTSPAHLLLPMSWFAALCFVNLALIAQWEQDVDAAHGHASLALGHPLVNRWIPLAPWLLFALAGWATIQPWGGPVLVTRCVAASAALLGALNRVEKPLGRRRARVLVDAALLTPLFLFVGYS